MDASLATALAVMTNLLRAGMEVSNLIRQAHAENRKLTLDELQRVMLLDDTARDALVLEIAKAKSEGR